MPKVAIEQAIPNRVTRSLRNRLVSADSDNSRSSTPVSERSPISEKEKKQTSTTSSPKTRSTRKDVTTPAKVVSRGRRTSLSEADISSVPSPVRRKIRGVSIASEDEVTTPTRTRYRKSPLVIDSPIKEENGSTEKENLPRKRGRPPKETVEVNNQEARNSERKGKDRNGSIVASDVIINLDDSDEEEIKSRKRASSETKNAQSSEEKKVNKKMMVKLKQMNIKDKVQDHEDNYSKNENIKRGVDDNKKRTRSENEIKKEYPKDNFSDDAEIESATIKSAQTASKESLSTSKEKKTDKTVDEKEKVEEENNLKENNIEKSTLKNQNQKNGDDSKDMKENEILNQAEKEYKNVTKDQATDEVYVEKFETKLVDLKSAEIAIEEKNTAMMVEELIDKDTDVDVEKGVETRGVDTIDKEQIDSARQRKNEGSERIVDKKLEENTNQPDANADEYAKIDSQGKDSVIKIISIDVITEGSLIEAETKNDENNIEKDILGEEEPKIANFNAINIKNTENKIQNQEDEDILTSQNENEKQRKEIQSVDKDKDQVVEKLKSVLEEEITCNDDENNSKTNLNGKNVPDETVIYNLEKSIEMEGIETHNISVDRTDRVEVSILNNITEEQHFEESEISESKELKKDGQHNISNSQEAQSKTLQEISDSYFTEQLEKNTTIGNADNDKSKKQRSVTFGTDNTDKKSINYPKTPLIMKSKSKSDSRSMSVRCLDTTSHTDTSTDISTLSKESDENLQEKSNDKKIDENVFPDSDTPYKGLKGKSSLSSSTPIATLKNQLEDGDENVVTLKQDINIIPNSIGENSSTNEAEAIISNEDRKKSTESEATTNFSLKNDNELKNSEYGFAKTWNQSVTVNVADDTNKGKYIDGLGLKTESKNEEKKILSIVKKNDTDCVLLSDLENYEESESDHENRNEFIDDEAEEAEEENSLCSEERAYLEENEIPVDGISIGSEDTDADNEEEEDESDSFVISDNEEDNELLSYDTEEIFSNSGDSAVRQKKKRKRVLLLASSGDEESDANDSKPDVNNTVEKLRNKREKNSSNTSIKERNTTIAPISNTKNMKSKEYSETDSFTHKKQMPKNRAIYLASSSEEEGNDNTYKAHNIHTSRETINEDNQKTIVDTKNGIISDDESSYESDEMLSSSDNNADNIHKKKAKKRSRIIISSDDEEKYEKDIIVVNTTTPEKINVKSVTLKDKINVLEPISENNESTQTVDTNIDLENVNVCISTDLNADANTIKDLNIAKEAESDNQSSPKDLQVSLKANTLTLQKSSEKEKNGDDSNLSEVSTAHQCSQENLQISLKNTSTSQKSSEEEKDGEDNNLSEVSTEHQCSQENLQISLKNTSTSQKSSEEEKDGDDSDLLEISTEHQCSQENLHISLKAKTSILQKSFQKDGGSRTLLEVSYQKDEDQILQNSEVVIQPSTTQNENSLDENAQQKESTAEDDCTNKEANRELSFSNKQESGSDSNTSANLQVSATYHSTSINNVNETLNIAKSLKVNEEDSYVKRRSTFKNKSLDLPRERKLSNEQEVLSSSFNCFINEKTQDSTFEDSNSEEENYIEKKEAIAKAVKCAAFLLHKQIEELIIAKSEFEKKKVKDDTSFSLLQQESTHAVYSDKQKSRLLPDSILEALDDGLNTKSRKQCHNKTQERVESKISSSTNSTARISKKHSKRKFITECFQQAKNISEIKTTSGVFFEEPIEEKRKKENKAKEEILSTIVLPTGLVYEQPLTPVHKKFVNGFEETRASPRPIGFKVKNILSAGQKEPPEYRKDSRGKRKLQLEEPTMVLPKPIWTNSGLFTVTKYPKQITQHDSEATEFMVAPLKAKKSKSITNVPLTVSSTALEFKKDALYSKQIPRETSKQLLQRKERQKFYKF